MLEMYEKSLPAGSTAAGAGTAFVVPMDCTHVTMYVVGSAGIASGAVQLEGAHDKDYAGTWAAIGSPVTAVASAVVKVVAVEAHKALRARISTEIGSGTVTVYILAVGLV